MLALLLFLFQFVNVCLLAELILCLGVSNNIVEAGFSYLTAMLSDRRLSISHSTMEDLMMIKANQSVWSPKEKDDILDSALDHYMSKRRKLQVARQGTV